MKNKKENAPTREKLISVAEYLMLVKGYAATTVDEICKTAEVTKGSFFHHFKSKEEIGKAVAEHFFQNVVLDIQSVTSGIVDPMERFNAFIQFIITSSKKPEKRYGCLLANFAQTLSETQPEIWALSGQYLEAITDIIRMELEEAKRIYAPNSAIDPRSLAETVMAMLEGALMMGQSKGDMSVVETIMLNCRELMAGMFMAGAAESQNSSSR